MKLRTEAPVNGGRNYNGPKVNDLASLSKIWLYAGKSEYPTLREGALKGHDFSRAARGTKTSRALAPDVPRVKMSWVQIISRKGQ
jgi:hypothetical protein